MVTYVYICLQCGRPGFDPWVGKIPWGRERLPTPVFWPGEFHGLYSPWGHKESDRTEQLSLHFLLSYVYCPFVFLFGELPFVLFSITALLLLICRMLSLCKEKDISDDLSLFSPV